MNYSAWYLGQVKFFDAHKGFGFIKNLSNGNDYFVHISGVRTAPIRDNDKVVFNRIASKRKVGSFDAKNVILLDQFNLDPSFLVSQFLSTTDYYFKKAILKALPADYALKLVVEEMETIDQILTDNECKALIEKIVLLKDLFKNALSEEIIISSISNHVNKIAAPIYLVRLWLNHIITNMPAEETIKEYFIALDRDSQKNVYQKANQEIRLQLFIIFTVQKKSTGLFHNLLYFLQLEKDPAIQNQYINMISESFNSEIFNLEQSDKYYSSIVRLSNNLDNSSYMSLVSIFYNAAADYVKLKIWLNDMINKEDYDIYHNNFIFLPTDDQIKYIKKLFYLLSKKANNISFENNIASLQKLTHSFAEGKHYNLDFSCNIILTSIDNIRAKGFLNEEAIFLLLTKHVENDTAALLSLSGFFEQCTGRSIPDLTEVVDDTTKKIITLKTIPAPRNIDFCEGVKFAEDGKDRIYKHDCWWCRGGSCYQANQSISLPVNYQNYTLANFFTILNIPFDKKSYFDFLGLVNKINNFLKHLNCRTCKHILKPNENRYYGYYRISRFICSNSRCNDKQTVYLTHCLGAKKTAIKSRCDNIIDSRDCVRCNYSKYNPSNDYEKYGPYICSHCGSCCSQKSFEKKQQELLQRNWKIQPGLDWKIINCVGHLEKGEIFCYKCGTELSDNEKEYKEFINNLEKPNNAFKILKKGINKYGFWYLIKAESTFFEKASQAGLRVSDTKDNDPNIKFVAQGNINLLICNKCKIKYDKTKVEFIIETEKAPTN